MTLFEKDAILSGIGISRIGRRTGIVGLELTLEAVRAAIEDAGLVASDIDGIATLGDTPAEDVNAQLGIEAADCGSGFGTGGLLSPVMSACRAVAERRARHVVVYRTIQMLGGTVPVKPQENAPAPPLARMFEAPEGAERPAVGAMDDVNDLVAANAYSAANWLALQLPAPHGALRDHQAAVGLGGPQRPTQRRVEPASRVPRPDDDGRLPAARGRCPPRSGCWTATSRSTARSRWWSRTPSTRVDCPHRAVAVEAIGGSDGAGGWFHRDDYPKMAMSDAAAQMWSRTDLKPSDLKVAELYDGFTFLTIAWLEALGICGDGEAGPYVEGGARIARDGELPLNTYGGQLSAGRMHGYWALHEGCLQLRGEAGERQVSQRPDVGVVSVGGGPVAGCMLLTC